MPVRMKRPAVSRINRIIPKIANQGPDSLKLRTNQPLGGMM
nr:MAG TPA: hypothetical protein [Caudoviricetes sp.]